MTFSRVETDGFWVRSGLCSLAGKCTYDILHNARKKTYGENYDVFTDDEEATGYSFSSCCPGSRFNRGRSLPALRRVAHVPNTTEETKDRFEQPIVRVFVHWLLREYWSQEDRPACLTGFNVKQIGSFLYDVKIEDIQELDYLCEVQLDLTDRELELVPDTCGGWLAKFSVEGNKFMQSEFERFCYTILEPILSPSRDIACDIPRDLPRDTQCDTPQGTRCDTPHDTPSITPCDTPRDTSHDTPRDTPHDAPRDTTRDAPRDTYVSDIYHHGPATCIELTWTCVRKHKHTVSIDISWSVKLKHDRVQADIIQRIRNLPGVFEGLEVHVNEHTFVYIGNNKWALSSSSYDQVLFNKLESKLTKHIRPFFRCLKALAKHILPHKLSYNGHLQSGYRAHDVVSSHALKCLMFEEIRRHERPSKWEEERLVDRLVGILWILHGISQNTYSEFCRDIITGKQLNVFSVNADMFQGSWVRDDLKALISHLQRPRYNTPFQTSAVDKQKDSFHLIRCCQVKEIFTQNDLHQTFMGYTYMYMTNGTRDLPYLNHPLLIWCKVYLNNLHQTTRAADLTLVAVDEFNYFMNLILGGTITKDDIVENQSRYKRKLAKLGDIIQKGDPNLWRCYVDSRFKVTARHPVRDYLTPQTLAKRDLRGVVKGKENIKTRIRRDMEESDFTPEHLEYLVVDCILKHDLIVNL